jgi:hypothetical protein
MISILWWRWSLNSMWPFSLLSFKSFPMLRIFLRVEELESLLIAMCLRIIFTYLPLYLSCLPTSYCHHAMVPIICDIVITGFHHVLVAALSSIPVQKMYWITPPSWSSWNYLSNEPSFTWNGFRTRELCLFYSGDAICPKLISDCVAHYISAISPCTGLQNWWSLMFWKEDLKELMNIKLSSIVHLWTRAQILLETVTSFSSLVDD